MAIPAAESTLTHRKEISARLDGALERSPADETELVWLEARHAGARFARRRPEIEERRENTVLVRVIDRGRVGSHRTGATGPGDLDNAIRAAVAQSRAREPVRGLPHLPPDEGQPPRPPQLRDKAISHLDARGVDRLTGRLRRRSERPGANRGGSHWRAVGSGNQP